jgi:hypothetical protein
MGRLTVFFGSQPNTEMAPPLAPRFEWPVSRKESASTSYRDRDQAGRSIQRAHDARQISKRCGGNIRSNEP